MNITTFHTITWGWILMALLLIPVQLYVTAPYGRHANASWGPMIDNRLGWVLMEIVSPLAFAWFFIRGDQIKTLPMWIFFCLWMAHYLNRSIIFPLRLRTKGKQMPVAIMLSASFFNLVNGFLNGYWLGFLSDPYPDSWLSDPRFITGTMLFFAGAGINQWADDQLIKLRKQGEKGYKIPQQGIFRYISCPNHFGEILEWTGFAILCWNLPALSFAIWTAANLIPRALSHHKWYLSYFEDYPKDRKAVLPGLL